MYRLPPNQIAAWVAFLISGAALFGSLVFGAGDSPLWIKFLGGLLFAFWIIGGVSLRQSFRVKHLRSDAPHAIVWSIGVFIDQFPQIDSLMRGLGAGKSRVWPNSLAIFVADQESVRVYGGMFFGVFGKPKLLLTLPTSAIASIAVAKAPQGTYKLWGIELGFDVKGRIVPWDVCLYQFRLPLTVPQSKLLDRRDQLQAAIGKS